MNIKILSSLTNEAEKRDDIFTIGTHNGIFHSDEVLTCAILCLINSDKSIQILRLQDYELLKHCDICVVTYFRNICYLSSSKFWNF